MATAHDVGRPDADPDTEDLLIARSSQFELFQRFVPVYLENSGGGPEPADSRTEIGVARHVQH